MTNAIVTTEGWDLVAVANQTLINQALAVAYNAPLFPHEISYTAFGIGFVGSLGVPVCDLNPAAARGTNSLAAIQVPVIGQLTYGATTYDVPPGATLTIISNLNYVEITLSGGTTAMQLYLNLTSKAAVYSVNIDASPIPGWVALLNGIIQMYLQTEYKGGSYFLGTVNMSSVPGSLQPVGNVYFATQPSSSNSSNNILALVANTSSGSSGILDFASNPALLPANQSAALYISNRCLLVNLVLPGLTTQLNTAINSFNISGNATTPYTLALNTTIDISGDYDPDLNSLNLYVNGSQNIQGDYGATGYPLKGFHSVIWVSVTGSFYISPTLTNGVISTNANAPKGDGSIHLSTGGWIIVGALIAASFGTLGGALATVVAVAVPIIIAKLNFPVSMSGLTTNLNKANLAFSWPAQQVCPVTSLSLPGDLVLYLDPQFPSSNISGFTGPYAPANWTEHTSATVGTLWNISSAPQNITLNSDPLWKVSTDWMTISAPANGTIEFSWACSSTDGIQHPCFYSVNDTKTQLNLSSASGTVSVPVSTGDLLSISCNSYDAAQVSLTLSNFTGPVTADS